MSERLYEIKNISKNKKRREIERSEKRSKTRDQLISINAKAASVSAASQENDLISESDEKESADESIASSMSRKKLKRPWKIDLSESMSSDGTVQIETESVNWMKETDLEFEKDKSVFDTIESSETDSDIEEVGEPVAPGKNKGVRKFSAWQKNKDKFLQEIVGWLPFSRNPVSIMIETLREKILMKEYDRIDDLMKALMMKIAFKSKVRTAHGIEASMLAILVPTLQNPPKTATLLRFLRERNSSKKPPRRQKV